jgi:hypothetical protein
MLVTRTCAAIGALVAVFLLVSAASAATPLRDPPEDFSVPGTIDCSQFNPEWTFDDDFIDTFHLETTLFVNKDGDLVRGITHVVHVSDDVNSETGFTLHEHNHFSFVDDFVAGTFTLNGAINVMQRRGVGSVIRNTGHKVFDGETGDPIFSGGPSIADEEDFCAALA